MNRLTISGALRIAEQQTEAGKRAEEAGEADGAERHQQWSETLEALQIMKQRGVPESMQDE